MASSRREFIKQASLWSAAATMTNLVSSCSDDDDASSSQSQASADAGPDTVVQTGFVIASTRSGKVRGRLVDGVNVFKGIPYAADTGGDARFLPPRPRASWEREGVRDALDYGPSAPQRDPDAVPTESAVTALIGDLSDRPESEDCLVLNVFTRSLSEKAKRPVMFWIHGGGFQAGSGSSPGYDGTHLVQRGDVVVVSINHRLNVFGFLCLGESAGEPTGNVGMLDIVQALKWVRENIARFGGDPDCVTIFGESGGGRKVGTLLAMPDAKGLFHRAIIQSGPTLRVLGQKEADNARNALFEALQLEPGDVDALRKLPAETLLRAYFAATRKYSFTHTVTGFAPVVDGRVLPAHPFDPQASDVMPDIPVIAGTNRTEMTLQLAGDEAAFALDDAGLEQRARMLLGDKAPDVLARYRSSAPDASPAELFFLMISDNRYCAPMMKLAERRAALGGAPVYFYYFTWETPVMGGRLRSPHALEISFVFDNTEISSRFTGGGERAAALAAKLSSAWIAFAETGKPKAEGLPEWTPYDADKRSTLVIHDESKMVDDPNRERRSAMQAALGLG